MEFVTGTFIDTLPASAKLTILALLLAIILAGCVWVLRKLINMNLKSKGQRSPSRLAVVDAAKIDSHRRMVLIRRDDVEHLVMIGGASDVLIESNIGDRFPSPMAQRQVLQEQSQSVKPEENLDDSDIDTPEFDNIFSSIETEDLLSDSPAQTKTKSSWRDKAGSAAILATAGVSTHLANNQVSDNQAEDERFSGQTNELNTGMEQNVDSDFEIGNTVPPSLSSPDNSHGNQQKDTIQSSAMPNKEDMEDEMQRLLNELTGEKT